MKKILTLLKNNWEFVGYCVLTVLIFCACFMRIFSWIATVYILFFAFFMQNEGKVLGLSLFVNSFNVVFSIETITIGYNLYNLPLLYIVISLLNLNIILLRVLKIKQEKQKLNLNVLLVFIVFVIYVALPVHVNVIYDLITFILSYLSFYVIFTMRKEINFCNVSRAFTAGLVLSSIFGLYQNISPLLHAFIINNVIYYKEIGLMFRFQGLCAHSMQFAALVMLAICVLLFLKHKQKISNLEFFISFIPLFVFGYMTLSRAYIVTIILALFLFAFFEIRKKRIRALPFLCFLLGIVAIIAIVYLKQTQTYLMRFVSGNSYTNVTGDAIEGEDFITDDPTIDVDRFSLLSVYFKDWISSIQVVLFGRGSSAMVFAVNSHNLFMQKIWELGLVGCILYVLMFVSLVNWKKIRDWKKYSLVLIIFLPWLVFAMVELMNFNYTAFVLIVLAIGIIDQSSLAKQNQIYVIDKSQSVVCSIKNDDDSKWKKLLSNIKLSIVIPVYNGQEYIVSTIDNLLQIRLNKEIIVINDGSTDNSLEVLHKYGDQIVLIDLPENRGAAYARNQGVQKATGDYITIIDIDDIVEPDMHERILSKMIRDEADVGMCNYDEFLLKGNVQKSKYHLIFDGLPQSEIIRLFLCDKIVPLMVTSIYRASLAKSIAFEKVFLAEDMIYQLRMILNARKTCFIDEPLYHYVQHVSSYTNGIPITVKLTERLAIPDRISPEEKQMLQENYMEEYEYFRLLTLLRCVHGISTVANKKNRKDAKKLIEKILSREKCKSIIKNQHTPSSIKFEFWIIKTFGVGFHLFVFPFYEAIKGALRS